MNNESSVAGVSNDTLRDIYSSEIALTKLYEDAEQRTEAAEDRAVALETIRDEYKKAAQEWHGRAVQVEAERDELRRQLAEAQQRAKDLQEKMDWIVAHDPEVTA